MRSGKRPPLDEERALFEATVAAEGVTTSAGEATGLSLVDAGLAGAGANSFVSMMAVLHPGDPTQVDSRDVTAFNNGTGEVTVASAFKGGQVAAGVPYKIVTFRFVLIGSVTPGTFSLANNTTEQDLLVIAAARQHLDIELDMSNLTQVNTIREYVQVDGANYKCISKKEFPTDFDDEAKAIVLSFVQKNAAYKITTQASVAEGAARDIPYRYMTRS